MLHKMFSIYDQKAKIFHKPYFNATHGEAERNFHQTVNSEKSTLNQYPKDFDLYYLGTYDDNTGKFQPVQSPEHIISAIQCLDEKSGNVTQINP